MTNLAAMCAAHQRNKLAPEQSVPIQRYSVKELASQWEQEQKATAENWDSEIKRVTAMRQLAALVSAPDVTVMPTKNPGEAVGEALAEFTNKALTFGRLGLDCLKSIGRTYANSVQVTRKQNIDPNNLAIAKRILNNETFDCTLSDGLNLRVVNGEVLKAW
jgi:hypothetical protein